ncbi:MAG TPA: isoprenylcysteine carboxylmethyltransferase family protein [Vicinamibacterales bacterium]|jgi:protein-S-isoprenylcysteine O-methyltransferase Ste14|nr:isoprenylcysteine carboxylmethyltransferase family protein [Vicinamibacterales bacterium]
MFPLMRGLSYATVFLSFFLVFLPARVLELAGINSVRPVGPVQVAGAIVVVLGLALALWCVVTFAVAGKGTPAPFDPPRRLVVRGPYSIVRNPMYVGGITALAGASLYYESLALLAFTSAFALTTHLFVLFYEEPTLARLFGDDYADYRRHVGRWRVRSRG